MNRIVILGDSLSMPRPDEGVNYEDTYPYLISKKDYEVICRSKRGNDTRIQTIKQNILDDVVFLKPNILIIHLGIVDCAPRLFTRLESRILSLFPNKIRSYIIGFFSKRRFFFTKLRQVSYVDSNSYKLNLEKLIYSFKKNIDKIIIIKINKTNKENELKSFNFNSQIDIYNRVIQNISSDLSDEIFIIEPNNCKEGLLQDGIHINSTMHHYIASEVQKILFLR